MVSDSIDRRPRGRRAARGVVGDGLAILVGAILAALAAGVSDSKSSCGRAEAAAAAAPSRAGQ